MCYKLVEQYLCDWGLPLDLARLIAQDYKYSYEDNSDDESEEEADWKYEYYLPYG